MEKIVKHIIGIAIGVCITLYFFSMCDRDKSGSEPEIVSVTVSDTIHTYKTHIDTVKFPVYDTTITYVEIPVPVYDTIRSLNNYTIHHSDSLIDLSVDLAIDGVLVDKPLFKYVPKFPQYIIKTDSVFRNINNTTTITKLINKRALYAGAVFGINNNKNLTQVSPTISFKDKKGNLFSYGYDLFNSEHRIGYQRVLKFK